MTHTGRLHTPEAKEKNRLSALLHWPERKDVFRPGSGPKNHNWKGDKADYVTIHGWVRSNFPPPMTCEHCKKAFKLRFLDAHNLSRMYKRERSDWRYLCRSCHAITERFQVVRKVRKESNMAEETVIETT